MATQRRTREHRRRHQRRCRRSGRLTCPQACNPLRWNGERFSRVRARIKRRLGSHCRAKNRPGRWETAAYVQSMTLLFVFMVAYMSLIAGRVDLKQRSTMRSRRLTADGVGSDPPRGFDRTRRRLLRHGRCRLPPGRAGQSRLAQPSPPSQTRRQRCSLCAGLRPDRHAVCHGDRDSIKPPGGR